MSTNTIRIESHSIKAHSGQDSDVERDLAAVHRTGSPEADEEGRERFLDELPSPVPFR